MSEVPLTDDEVAQQILSTFARYKIKPDGKLRRTHFFHVRDGDFGRGMATARLRGWLTVHHRDRYTYILTDDGFTAGIGTGTL